MQKEKKHIPLAFTKAIQEKYRYMSAVVSVQVF